MTKKILIGLGLTFLLAFTGCSDETQASSNEIRWNNVLDPTNMNEKEKSLYSGDMNLSKREYKLCKLHSITYYDIEYNMPLMFGLFGKLLPNANLAQGIFVDKALENIGNFHKDSPDKTTKEDFKKYLQNLYKREISFNRVDF